MTASAGYPTSIDDLTAEWFTRALDERFPGVLVSAAKLTDRIDGTATKLRFELDFIEPAGAPGFLWIKGGFDPRGAEQDEAFVNEVRFFRDLAPRIEANLPESYFGLIEPATRNGLVALEDLTLRNVRFGPGALALSVNEVAEILSVQASYHAPFWNGAGLENQAWLKPGGAIAAAGMVDQYFALWPGAHAYPRFAHVPGDQRHSGRMRAALNRLIQHLRSHPVCLVHGDAHAANLFFDPKRGPGYLDWQHVMRGHWAFDLSGLMVTALSVEDRRERERDLLGHYLRELRTRGADAPAFDAAWLDYRRYAGWAFMWVMCPVDAHAEAICTAHTERACAAIDDLETLPLLERD